MRPLQTLTFNHSRAKNPPDTPRRDSDHKPIAKGEAYSLKISPNNKLPERWCNLLAPAAWLPHLSGLSAAFLDKPVIPFTHRRHIQIGNL